MLANQNGSIVNSLGNGVNDDPRCEASVNARDRAAIKKGWVWIQRPGIAVEADGQTVKDTEGGSKAFFKLRKRNKG